MDITNQLIDTIFLFSRSMREKMCIKSDVGALSVVQLQTLFFLKKNMVSSMRKIAEYLQIELPSATNLVNTLVKLMLVTRSADKEDKRVVNITLTQKAKKLLEEVKKERIKAMSTVLSHLSEKDKKQLLEILKKLMKGMEGKNER